MSDCERCGGMMLQGKCMSCGQYPITSAERLAFGAAAAKKERDDENLSAVAQRSVEFSKIQASIRVSIQAEKEERLIRQFNFPPDTYSAMRIDCYNQKVLTHTCVQCGGSLDYVRKECSKCKRTLR